MKYDMTFILEEDHSFKMTVPLRDFVPGTVMLNNIAEAVMKSRRMIMLLSRLVLHLVPKTKILV